MLDGPDALLLCRHSFAPGPDAALAVAAGTVFFFSLPTGLMAAAMQVGAPSRMRGVVGGFYTFFGQLIGFGLGPTAIALVTDRVFGNPKMVGYSIAIVCSIASAIAAWPIFSRCRTIDGCWTRIGRASRLTFSKRVTGAGSVFALPARFDFVLASGANRRRCRRVAAHLESRKNDAGESSVDAIAT